MEKYKKIIAKRIKMLRINCGMDQRQFANTIGCAQKDVSGWESGKKMISIMHMFNICDAFNLKLDYFDPRTPGPENTINGMKNDGGK